MLLRPSPTGRGAKGNQSPSGASIVPFFCSGDFTSPRSLEGPRSGACHAACPERSRREPGRAFARGKRAQSRPHLHQFLVDGNGDKDFFGFVDILLFSAQPPRLSSRIPAFFAG